MAEESSENLTLGQFRAASMTQLSSQDCHAKKMDDSLWLAFEFPFVKPQQHLCIRGTLDVSGNEYSGKELPENPALLFAALAAYDIYLDGEPLGQNGMPGASKNTEQVGGISLLLPLDKKALAPGEHLISMEISSFGAAPDFTAVAWALLLIDQQAFFKTLLTVSIVTALLVGGLLVMFVIFTTLYLGFSRQKSYLLFSLLCFFTAGLLVVEQWKLWVNYSYDLHLHRLYIIIAITLVVTTLLPGFYLWQYELKRQRWWCAGLVLALMAAGVITPSYDARSEWLFIVSLGFVLAINLMALWCKKPGAMTALCITGVSLLAILFAPRLFIELGFGLSIALVLASIGVSLLNQLINQRNLALETGKVKGELLRRNLQPHYLMNCLMQVQELIDFAPQQANEFVQQLANEFRALVKMSDKDLVTLQDELQLCRSHLKIMSVRYQQDYQLDVNLTVGLNESQVMVPAAILHSQIENCFTHNRINSNQSLILDVSIDAETIVLELLTPVDVATEHQGAGIGEAYIRAKMTQVCKPGWQLQNRAVDQSWQTRYQYQLSSELVSRELVSHNSEGQKSGEQVP